MNLNQRMESLERKIDLLLSMQNVEANPGATTDEGRTFAPGSGPIAEYTPSSDEPAVDPKQYVARAKQELAEAEARRTLRRHPDRRQPRHNPRSTLVSDTPNTPISEVRFGADHDRAIIAAMQRIGLAGEDPIDVIVDYFDPLTPIASALQQFADFGLRALAEIDRLTAALADRDATIAELKGLLREHTDNEKCSFDHHGYCQTHSDFSIEPGDICYMERSRRAVGESETP